ncbi:MAG: hypothetical protein EYC62_02550 [Alphaproteobacteria bacterium]|nr:MAG: hypothetical protein EYC62_02550 [Alphaproteobacteria bacterium]
MPFRTSIQSLDTLPDARLSRADESTQKKHEATLLALLTEGQRLIQDNPDAYHVARAASIFKKLGFHTHAKHPEFDQLTIETTKGLIECAKQYAQPSNPRMEPSISHAQDCLLHAAFVITNPSFCYETDTSGHQDPETGLPPNRKRDAYKSVGIPLRRNVVLELLALAEKVAETEQRPLKQGSFALDCVEWAYRLAGKHTGARESAIKAYATYTKSDDNPEGIDIRTLGNEIPSVPAKVKPSSEAGVGACAPEATRAAAHHHPASPRHAGAERVY